MSTYPEAAGVMRGGPCPSPACFGSRRMGMRPPAGGLDLGPGYWECSLEPEAHCGYLWAKDLRRELGPLFGDVITEPPPPDCLVYPYGLDLAVGRSHVMRRPVSTMEVRTCR